MPVREQPHGPGSYLARRLAGLQHPRRLWALASPLFNVPDEPSHTLYAVAAVRGEIWAPADGLQTTVTVPAGYGNAHDVFNCYVFDVTIPAGCAEAFVASTAPPRSRRPRAGTRRPLHVRGLGSLVADGAKAVYAMRLLTVVLSAPSWHQPSAASSRVAAGPSPSWASGSRPPRCSSTSPVRSIRRRRRSPRASCSGRAAQLCCWPEEDGLFR